MLNLKNNYEYKIENNRTIFEKKTTIKMNFASYYVKIGSRGTYENILNNSKT